MSKNVSKYALVRTIIIKWKGDKEGKAIPYGMLDENANIHT